MAVSLVPNSGTRFIGIQHRVKKTADQESHPTIVAIVRNGDTEILKLETELEEFDFMHGKFPISYRDVKDDDDLLSFPSHQIKWRDLKKGEDPTTFPTDRIRTEEGVFQTVTKVPSAFDGLQTGDRVAMALGGSGDYFSFALSSKGQTINASVHRIPPFHLKTERGDAPKTDDAVLLTKLLSEKPQLFYLVKQRDLDLIKVRILTADRRNTQRDRIACAHRVRARSIGAIFCSEAGLYPQGQFEKIAQEQVANSVTLQAIAKEEKTVTAMLAKAVEGLDVYSEILKPVEGMGPAIAGPILSHIIDIRRFESDAKLKAYCGVHVMQDGTFPRRRRGIVANWPGALRQALYNFGDQCVRRKDSKWGAYYRTMKIRLREKHPEVIVENGKKKYTNGHIHKMAIWRTLTRFVEWLFKEWWKLESKVKGVTQISEATLRAAD